MTPESERECIQIMCRRLPEPPPTTQRKQEYIRDVIADMMKRQETRIR